MSAPFSSSTRSGVVPELREASSASSTCSREARPISTITSVRKRGEEPRREGLVTPAREASRRRRGVLRRPRRRRVATPSPSAAPRRRSASVDASTRRRAPPSPSGVGIHRPSTARRDRRSAPVGSPSIPKIACRSGPVCWARRSSARTPGARGASRPRSCSRAARRMTSSGARAAGPQLEAERALRDEHLEPVEVCAPCARAAASSGVDPER